MHQERASFPTDRHQQSPIPTDPDGEFQEAASILEGIHGFGGALWDAEMNEALGAKQKIKNVPVPGKKAALQSCMNDLAKSMVAEIERWAPEYVKLAAAYSQFAERGPIEWTRSQMQKVINQRLRKPDCNGAAAFCLITMSGGDVQQKQQWRAPNWMYGSPQACRSLRMDPTNFIIQEKHNDLVLRLNGALDQTLARMKISLVVAAGQDHKVPDRKEDGSIFTHSKDYQNIHYRGSGFLLSIQQAAIIRVVHQAHLAGMEATSTTQIQLAVKCGKISDSFRAGDGPKLWRRLLVPLKGRHGMYRLDPDIVAQTENGHSGIKH